MSKKILHQPTDNTRGAVQAMIATGNTRRGIAAYLRIAESTLRKHYKEELKIGQEVVTATISGILVQEALKGKPWAVCFFLKTQAGWREHHKVDIEGDLNVSSLSDEELAERKARLAAIEQAAKRKAYDRGGNAPPPVPE